MDVSDQKGGFGEEGNANVEVPLQVDAARLLNSDTLSFDGDEELGGEKLNMQTRNEDSADDAADHIVQSVDPSAESGILPTAFNFANSIIGAGIIGLPYALEESGFGLGLILIIVLGIVVDWSVNLLVRNGKICGRDTYQSVVQHCFGKWGFYFISLCQFLFAFGAMCAYLVIVGQTITPVMVNFTSEGSPLRERRLWISLGVIFLMLPLSLPRNISFLAKTSLLSLMAVLFLVFAVTIEGTIYRSDDSYVQPPTDISFAHSNFFQAIGVISFAFVCHHNTFMLYASLKQRSLKRWATVTHISVVFALVCCIVLAVAGYLSFFENTKPNILDSFPCDNTVINVARIIFAVNMFFTYPLETFVAREVLDEVFFPTSVITQHRHVAWTLGLVIVSWAISMATDNLGVVLELTGTLSASALAFILPGACYIKLASGKILSWKKFPALLLTSFGVIVLVVGSVETIIDAVAGNGPSGLVCGGNSTRT